MNLYRYLSSHLFTNLSTILLGEALQGSDNRPSLRYQDHIKRNAEEEKEREHHRDLF